MRAAATTFKRKLTLRVIAIMLSDIEKIRKMNERFTPDPKHIIDAAWNRRAERIPLYEHGIDLRIMESVLGVPVFSIFRRGSSMKEYKEYYGRSIEFYRFMGYDFVNLDQNIGSYMPGAGALLNENNGVISDRASFNEYPWKTVPRVFKDGAYPHYETFLSLMPDDMAAFGGVGNGVFECVQDLVGFIRLCYLMADDPDLCRDIFARMAETIAEIWTDFLKAFGDAYGVFRFGDDLGFKTSTMLSPRDIEELIIPGYIPVIDLIHSYGKPLVYHSCGCIFNVMDSIIAKAGINAKHSNEDTIAPISEWVSRYNDRIGIFGGIDVDKLCRCGDDELRDEVASVHRLARGANGFAFGSGNSIAHYVPWERYIKMVALFRELRGEKAVD